MLLQNHHVLNQIIPIPWLYEVLRDIIIRAKNILQDVCNNNSDDIRNIVLSDSALDRFFVWPWLSVVHFLNTIKKKKQFTDSCFQR